MRRNQNGGISEGHPYLQAGLSAGYVCRCTEEELERIGAASGGAVSARELGEWVGKFFLSKSQAHPNGLDRGQRLSQVRPHPAEGYALSAGETETHVLPRHKRSLSIAARKAISRAQRERWAKYNAAKHAANPELEEKRARWRKAKRKERTDKGQKKIGRPTLQSRTQSKYWSMMTPKQRSEEMIRRFKVRDEKRKAKAAA